MRGLIVGADAIAATPDRKRQLFTQTGALAVDLESAAVAEACAAAGKPFAVIRAVADPVHRRLPDLTLDALDEEGRSLPMKVAAGLLRRPFDLPGLIRVGLDPPSPPPGKPCQLWRRRWVGWARPSASSRTRLSSRRPSNSFCAGR